MGVIQPRQVLLIIWLAATVAGCTTPAARKSQLLARVFGELPEPHLRQPVIFVPGVLGSVLEDTATGKTIWGPGGGREVQQLALPIDGRTLRDDQDTIAARNLLFRVQGLGHLVEFRLTEDLRDALTKAGRYRHGDLEHPQPGETCFPFWYDWRRDLVEAARRLGQAIERLKQRIGDPNLKVQLVCHSAGGLVARYYVKYGTEDVLGHDPLPAPTYAGARHVSRVIMLGTPNRGSMDAFRVLHEGIHVPFMGRLSPPVIFTMPSVYELLPHEDEQVFLDAQGRSLDVNLYDPANWERYGWSAFAPGHLSRLRHGFFQRHGEAGEAAYRRYLEHQRRFLALVLARAKHFHQALARGDPHDDPVEYLLMGSDCQPTLQGALLVKDGLAWRMEFSPDRAGLKRKLFALGDGSVTRRSLVGPWQTEGGLGSRVSSAQAVFVCEAHPRLTQNLTYLSNVLHALLDPRGLAQHRAVCELCRLDLATGRWSLERRTRAKQ